MGKLCRRNIGVSDVVGAYCRGRGGATRSRAGANRSAHHGYEALSAGTVEQAIALLEGDQKPDLLFTDLG